MKQIKIFLLLYICFFGISRHSYAGGLPNDLTLQNFIIEIFCEGQPSNFGLSCAKGINLPASTCNYQGYINGRSKYSLFMQIEELIHIACTTDGYHGEFLGNAESIEMMFGTIQSTICKKGYKHPDIKENNYARFICIKDPDYKEETPTVVTAQPAIKPVSTGSDMKEAPVYTEPEEEPTVVTAQKNPESLSTGDAYENFLKTPEGICTQKENGEWENNTCICPDGKKWNKEHNSCDKKVREVEKIDTLKTPTKGIDVKDPIKPTISTDKLTTDTEGADVEKDKCEKIASIKPGMECYQDSTTKEWKTRWKVKEGDECDIKDCFDTQNTLSCKFVWVPESFVCVAKTCKEGYKIHGHGCEEKNKKVAESNAKFICENEEKGKWVDNGKITTCTCPKQQEGYFWNSETNKCELEDYDAEREEEENKKLAEEIKCTQLPKNATSGVKITEGTSSYCRITECKDGYKPSEDKKTCVKEEKEKLDALKRKGMVCTAEYNKEHPDNKVALATYDENGKCQTKDKNAKSDEQPEEAPAQTPTGEAEGPKDGNEKNAEEETKPAAPVDNTAEIEANLNSDMEEIHKTFLEKIEQLKKTNGKK